MSSENDESDTTEEQFDRMWERATPVETVTADPTREPTIKAVAEAIWLHHVRTSGTSAGGVTPQQTVLAAEIVDLFTCTECGFLDASLGNAHGECNDCAPRVTARKRGSV